LSLAALAPISPEHLKKILELHGYSVIAEDEYNWALGNNPLGEPLILPKLGDSVALEVLMDAVFVKSAMNLQRYLFLKGKAESAGFGLRIQ
jgi:hypothetical protein